jgi:MoxR-like ATPase
LRRKRHFAFLRLLIRAQTLCWFAPERDGGTESFCAGDTGKLLKNKKRGCRENCGSPLPNFDEILPGGTMKELNSTKDYIASPELLRVAEIARALQKPLLIKGEPGTGKTMLAQAVAESLGMELMVWNIKSTTKAQDGLYVYDTVARLYDSQLGESGVNDIRKYIKLGKMGEAFRAGEQVVLLIDEIDKADLEFPNDLLWELDRMEFYIPETKETVRAKHRPIVIITSNAEKELPDAFLRRCIFHYIAFPDAPMMERIVRAHYPELDSRLLDQALEQFYALRSRSLQKKPSTSELLDWVQALSIGGVDPELLRKTLPFAGVLLKKTEDMDAIGRR